MPTKLRVLFADDHEIFRAGLRQVLAENQQIQIVAEVADGDSALSEIRVQKPDVAVLDFDLPRRDGLGVVRELQRLHDRTPTVILTAHRAEALFDDAIALGVGGYLLKDDAATQLLQCLRVVAAGGTFLSPAFSGYLLKRRQRTEALRQEVRGLDALSPAERRVLRLISLGQATKEIAAELFLSPATVETHRKNICAKLGLHGANKLLAFAIEHRSTLA